MKNLCFYLILAAGLLLACNNKNKSGEKAPMASAAEIAETKSELDKEIEKLQQLSPYTIDQMKALLPIELGGDSASNIEAYTHMGTGFAKADYPISDSTSLEVSVFDCGGVAGAGFYNAQFVNQLGNQSQSENEYTKVVDFKGGKAIEHFTKKRALSSLTYTAADRFLVILEGKGIETGELKDKAGELKFK